EFVDASGAPRIRVRAPYVVDAEGARHPASLQIEGCAYDTDPSPPWDRPVTPPGASACTLAVRWRARDMRYPIVIDPAWTSTGNMADAREQHSGALLANGRVLVATGAGPNVTPLTSAELYDPLTGTWAMTGAVHQARSRHTTTVLPSGRV